MTDSTNPIPQDDFEASVRTTGRVSVGSSIMGEIESGHDVDWFAVELEAGKTYRIDVMGKVSSGNPNAALTDPVLEGIYDAGGKLIPRTHDDDSSLTRWDALKLFTPETSGTYYIAARGDSTYGATHTGTYLVAVRESEDDYPESVSTTGKVTVGGSATGRVDVPNDRDWFAVELEAGKFYRIHVKGADTGDGTLPDPGLAGIYDADGTLIPGTSDDVSGEGDNALKFFRPPTSGTYHFAATSGTFGTMRNETGTYTVAVEEAKDDYAASVATTGRVTVGGSATGEITPPVNGQRDHDWFAVQLEAGETYRIEVNSGRLPDPALVGIYDANGEFIPGTSDDNGGFRWNSRKLFTPDTSGTYYVAATTGPTGVNHDVDTGTYTVTVDKKDDYAASVATTGKVAVGGSTTGKIDELGDRDWFAVELEAGKVYRTEVKGADSGDGTLRDPTHWIKNAHGGFVSGTTAGNGEGLNSLDYFIPDTSGTYHVEVGAGWSFGNPIYKTGTYTVAVEEVKDDYADSVATTGRVTVGGSATGEISPLAGGRRDHDWFAVELEADKPYWIEVKGGTGYDALPDPLLQGIYDAGGTLIPGTSDDDGGKGRSSLKFFTPDTSGTYYVAATTGTFGSGTGIYVVAVEGEQEASVATTGKVAVGGSATGGVDVPNDRDWFAVELEAGKPYRIEVKGRSTGDGTLRDPHLYGVHDADGKLIPGTEDYNSGEGLLNSLEHFTPDTSGTYYVATGGHGRATGTYTVAVREEPDDYRASVETTGKVAVGGSATGEINMPGYSTHVPYDRDWFAVELEAGTVYRIEVKGASTRDGTLRDPLLFGIYDADGKPNPGTHDYDSGEGDNSLKLITPVTSGIYHVAVAGFYSSGTYTVAVNVEPSGSGGVPVGTVPKEEEERLPLEADDTSSRSAGDTLAGTSGADALDGLGGNDIARGLGGDDRLWGRQGADTLYGNAGNDRLWGGQGGDELHGGAGKDHLYGGLGHDTLYGGRGDDTLYGGRLADRLHGGEGRDVLVGGHGRDLFVYDDADFGRDRIVDFEDGVDRLDFTGSGLRWGDLSVSNNGNGHAVVRVDGANSKIVLEGVDASLIDQNDFIF